MSPTRFVSLIVALLLATSAGCGPLTINVGDTRPQGTKSPGARPARPGSVSPTPDVPAVSPVASPTPSSKVSPDGTLTVTTGGRASAGPVDAAKTGHISGFVYGENGKSQPIPLAFVSTGTVSAFAGNPDSLEVIDFDNEFQEPANATQRISVQHDFNDGRGLVVTERVLRKNPPKPGTDELDIEDVPERELAIARLNYVYLRPGEFFLEGVPAGIANLQASFGNVASANTPVTVLAGILVTDLVLNLTLPETVLREGGGAPQIVEWTALRPETGITIRVGTKPSTVGGSEPLETTLSFTPDPPDVAVTLKAPPGAGGAVIEAVDIVYVYNTPARQRTSQAPLQIGPIRIPVSRVVVAAAQELAFGPPATVTVPISASTLTPMFASQNADERPGLIVANMEFIGENGLKVQDKTFQNLQVSAVLRAL